MAENNSSAPLKTAEVAYPVLPASVADVVCWGDANPLDIDWGAGARLAGGTRLYTAEQMRAYAAQALAAQAPAAVAVPPSAPGLSGDAALAHEQCRAVVHLALAVAEVYSSNALIVASDSRLADQIGAASAEVMEHLGDTLNSTDATTEEDEWLDPIFEAAQERWPATEDSSAGDLAEVNSPQEATIEGAAYEVGKWLNERPNRPIDLRHVAMLVHYAKTQAEVQAEPVMIYHGRCTIDCGEHGHHDVEMLKMIPAGANLYTAPQAQPADALDAKALLTHRAPWRDALVQMTTRGLTSDDAEQLYWRHELKAFDEAFAAMAAAQEGGNAAKEA